ncbi:MAG: long-chain fatty acid--CoA ligase, partial [Dongiaceae bacterium]
LLIDALEKGDPSNLPKVDIGLDDTACIIYTSGTEGNPKGVMLSHGALLHNCRAAYHIVKGLGIGREVFLSFLPLSHSYEHLAGHFFPVMIGAEIYYAEGADALLKNMAECRPTIMTAVPRLYEVIRSRILQQVKRGSWLSQKLFAARNVPVLNILVRRKIKQKFGGRLKAFVSGGAPLQVEVGEFFQSLGVRVLQGYGQTESAPLISCNLPGSEKIHTVGPIVPEVEVKIADDGEILARGPNLMQGYWQNNEATSKTIIDGWLHTGDIGHLDEDKHLVITDRKKEIIVVSGGDNISPQRVEGILCLEPAISQAMVYGDKKPYLTAVIVPNKDFDKAMAAKAIETANAKLSALEKVKKFILAEEAFTIENGLLTPTLKLRRRKIKEIYGERLEGLY